jgi:hypothetical protein
VLFVLLKWPLYIRAFLTARYIFDMLSGVTRSFSVLMPSLDLQEFSVPVLRVCTCIIDITSTPATSSACTNLPGLLIFFHESTFLK